MGVRSSMLELAILGELEEPLHGYELRKRLSRSLGPVRRLSFGSLYPALHRLDDSGLIAVVDVVPPGTKTSTWLSGRSGRPELPSSTKKQVVYQTTKAGQEHLQSALAKVELDDDSIDLAMGLMSHATPATRLTLLMKRRSQVLARHEASEKAKLSSDYWIRSKGELDSQQTLSELSWIDRLIQDDPGLQSASHNNN